MAQGSLEKLDPWPHNGRAGPGGAHSSVAATKKTEQDSQS